MLGSTQQVGAHPVREARADAGPQGQDGLLDRHARAPLDPRRARDRRGARGVAGADEADQHVPRAAAVAPRRGRPAAHDLQPDGRLDRPALDDEPEPAGDPDPDGARPGDPLGLRRRPRSPARLRRLQPGRAAHPRARLGRARPARVLRAQRGHPRPHGGRGARQGSGDAHEGRAQRRQDGQLRDHLRHLVVRALGEPRDPARGGAGLHRRLSGALPARAGLHPADDRAGRARRVRDDAAGPPPARSRDPRLEPADARPRRTARGQLRHAGHGRRHHQGGDDPHPQAAARGGKGRAPRPAGARRAARSRPPRPRRAP